MYMNYKVHIPNVFTQSDIYHGIIYSAAWLDAPDDSGRPGRMIYGVPVKEQGAGRVVGVYRCKTPIAS